MFKIVHITVSEANVYKSDIVPKVYLKTNGNSSKDHSTQHRYMKEQTFRFYAKLIVESFHNTMGFTRSLVYFVCS